MSTLREAAQALLDRYTSLVNCGDCGNWDPETEPDVIALRAELAKPDARPAPAEPQPERDFAAEVDHWMKRSKEWRKRAEAAESAVSEFHHAIKDAGWHPGRTDDSLPDIIRAKGAELRAAPAPPPAGGERKPAAQQEPLTVDYSGCDICARETATIAGFRLMVDPSLPPDVLVFRQGEREVGRIINAGITATKGDNHA